MKKTQSEFIMNHLIKHGKISRNFALKNFISRLGAYICDFRQAGFIITGEYVKKNGGKDFVYTLVR